MLQRRLTVEWRATDQAALDGQEPAPSNCAPC
jgi:hypothetical protein